MSLLSLVLALAVWGVLPGWLLLRVAGARWSAPEMLAAAPGLSLASMAACAHLSEAVGLPVSPFALAPTLAVLFAYLAALRRPAPRPRAKWPDWLVFAAPIPVVVLLLPMLSVPVIPPTLHDGLDHATYFRLILDTRSLDRFEVMLPPFYENGAPLYYPWGLHAWAALVAQTTTLPPMQVLTPALLFVSSAVPLSVYALSAQFLGRGWPAVATAFLSLVVWALPFDLWHWGGYALLAGAVAALPVVRLALACFSSPALFAATAAAAVGVLLIHPSQAMAALLIATVAIAVEHHRFRHAIPFVVAVALVGLALSIGPSVWVPLREFADRASAQGDLARGQAVWAWPFGLYGRPHPWGDGRSWIFALALIGAVLSIKDRRGRVFVALHVLISLMLLLAPAKTWLTMLSYHEPERVWYLQIVCIPGLAALGLAGVVRFALRLRPTARPAVAWSALLAGCVIVLGARHFTQGRARIIDSARGKLSYTDQRVLADFDWLERHVPHDEIVFNASTDWALAQPFTGHRFVFWRGGIALSPKTHSWERMATLLGRIKRPELFATTAVTELLQHGMRHVFAASYRQRDDKSDPAKDGRLVPAMLERNPLFERVYRSDTASVFRIRDARVHTLDFIGETNVKLSGFHPRERVDDFWLRWTQGKGRVRVQDPALSGSACFFSVHGPELRDLEVRVDGRRLEPTQLGHSIPKELWAATSLELELVSSTFRPTTRTKTKDPRVLGVSVSALALVCLP